MTMLNTFDSVEETKNSSLGKKIIMYFMVTVLWNRTGMTHQTVLSWSPGHVAPNWPCCLERDCLWPWLRPVQLHSWSCHWLPQHELKAEPRASSRYISIETWAMWPKQLNSVAVETHPLFRYPLSSSWTPSIYSFTLLLLHLFTAHYSVQHFQGYTEGREMLGPLCSL